MFDPASFVRVAAFAVVFAAIEYRYINSQESHGNGSTSLVQEKPVFWVIAPYHLYLLLPLFVVVSFAWPLTAWAGNAFVLAVLEDVAYFVWRGSPVGPGEWTTTLFGALKLGKLVVPVWWPLDALVAAVLFWAPF